MSSDLESSVVDAVKECAQYAKTFRYLSREGVAEKMGFTGGARWVVYKWVDEGKVPARHIPAFERACGTNLLTSCLVRVAGQIAVPMLPPESAPPLDLARTQVVLAEAMATVTSALYDGDRRGQAVTAINSAIEALAGLRHKLAGRSAS